MKERVRRTHTHLDRARGRQTDIQGDWLTGRGGGGGGGRCGEVGHIFQNRCDDRDRQRDRQINMDWGAGPGGKGGGGGAREKEVGSIVRRDSETERQTQRLNDRGRERQMKRG